MRGRIVTHAGEVFHQIRGQPFTYVINGNAIRPSTTNWNIPRSHLEQALDLVPLENTVAVRRLMGPSYLYGILMDKRIRASDW